jgi:TrmH family RNA methyltransferase
MAIKGESSWAATIEDVRRAATMRGRARLGQYAIEGVRLLERAIRAGVLPRRAVISERLLRQKDARIKAVLVDLEAAACEIFAVPEAVLLELAEGRNSGLILGLCDLPEQPPLERLRERSQSSGAPIVVLVDVEEPGNVGALVRTALAAGAVGLIACGASDPYHPKAVRTSMGSVFKLPICREFEVQPVLEQMGGLARIGAVPDGGRAPWALTLHEGCALLLGRESQGLPVDLIAQLEAQVTIPMPEGVDSYSVNAAAAAILYEAMRQRSLPSS